MCTQSLRIPYLYGDGCQNTFIIFDLLAYPHYFTDTFIENAHKALLREERDDALILLPTTDSDTVIMKVLEPDGSFANFCGNGARVIAAYLYKQFGLPKR